MNLPFIISGRVAATLESAALAFSISLSLAKLRLPTTTERLAVLSILYSTLPPLTSLMADSTSSVTVPLLGLGMRPRGPSMRASLRTSFIAEVVATATSNSIQPPSISFMRSSRPALSAPAAIADSAWSVNTTTLTFLPLPLGRRTVPRTIWLLCLGSTLSLNESSTVSSKPAFGMDWRAATASASADGFWASDSAAFLYLLLLLTMTFCFVVSCF